MTTVTVYISGIDSTDSISIRNGLFGPATDIFHAIVDACKEGSAVGEWSGAHAQAVVAGRVLKSLLSNIGRLEGPYHSAQDNEKLNTFLNSVVDDYMYEIKAREH